MRTHLTVILALIIAVSACSNKAESSATDKPCVSPSNPWAGDRGGHEAGFSWAQEKHYECPSDHGSSFEEGCAEYYNQFHRYEACEAAKNR